MPNSEHPAEGKKKLNIPENFWDEISPEEAAEASSGKPMSLNLDQLADTGDSGYEPAVAGEDPFSVDFAAAPEDETEEEAEKIPEKYRKNSPKNTKKNPMLDFWQSMSKPQRYIAIASVLLVLVILVTLLALIPAFGKTTSGDEDISSIAQSEEIVEETGYNPQENALDTAVFEGTILATTADAGEEYIADTLFLGDSNTVRMMMYGDTTGATSQNAIGVVGMGIQSVTSNKCVSFEGYSSAVTMVEAVKILQPRRVVITFGTNNVAGMTVETFINHYKATLEAIEDAYPYCDIIIAAVPPVDRYHINENISMTNIDKYNLALVELAEELGHRFLNWSEALKDDATGFCVSGYTEDDGIHFTRSGLAAMFEYLRTHAYNTEDRRPKPLNNIPKRIVTDTSNAASSSSSSQPESTSSETTSEVGFATIVFSAVLENGSAGGGTFTVDSQSHGASYSTELEIGATVPAIRAVAAAGYQFVRWEQGTSSIGTSPTLSGYSLDEDTANGSRITIRAVFRATVTDNVDTPTNNGGGGDGGGGGETPTIPTDPSTSSESTSSEAPSSSSSSSSSSSQAPSSEPSAEPEPSIPAEPSTEEPSITEPVDPPPDETE